MAKGKKTRQVKTIACAEGMTLHGLPITRDQIQEMAQDYDRNMYCGRVNMEHIKSVLPDSQWRSYGLISDVNTVELTEGELAGKLGLEVTMDIDDVNDEFIVKLNQSGQKIFSSIEFWPEFPQTKRAYLTAVALTDYPAAVGSRVIELSTRSRGLPETGNTYSASLETHLSWLEMQENDHKTEKDDSKTFLSTVLKSLGFERRHNADINADVREAITLTAKQCGSLLNAQENLENELSTLKQELSTTKTELATLKQQLSREDGSNEFRPTVDGVELSLCDF